MMKRRRKEFLSTHGSNLKCKLLENCRLKFKSTFLCRQLEQQEKWPEQRRQMLRNKKIEKLKISLHLKSVQRVQQWTIKKENEAQELKSLRWKLRSALIDKSTTWQKKPLQLKKNISFRNWLVKKKMKTRLSVEARSTEKMKSLLVERSWFVISQLFGT